MNTWKLTGPKKMELVQEVENLSLNSFAKVKITMVGVSQNEFKLFSGIGEQDYPITLGHLAVGIISEIDENSSYLKKGDRVIISPFFSCGNCLKCKSGNNNECTNIYSAGFKNDGFLKDFALIPIDNLYLLPERISDKEAIFIPYIASAIHSFAKIKYEAGSFIGVGSGGLLGNLIAQLAMYYQCIPIVFDKQQSYLDTAKEVGIYYAFDNDDTTLKKVMQVTSGKLVDSMIYINKRAMQVSDCFTFIKNGGSLVLSTTTSHDNVFENLSIYELLVHQISVFPTPLSKDNFISAINLLVNGKIEVLPLISGEVNFSDVPSFFESKMIETANDKHFLYAITV